MNNSLPLERENFGSLRKPYFLLQGDELTLHNYPVGSEPDPLTATEPSQEPELGSDPPLDFTQPVFARSALYRYLVPRLRVAAPALALSLAEWGVIEPGSETSNAEQGANYIPTAYGVYR